MRTIAELIRWRGARHPDLSAIWYQGRARTYGALDQSSSQLAAGLAHQLGLQPGDRVAILDKNSDAYVELLFALDKAGLVAAPINRRLTAPEIAAVIGDIDPKLIVVGEAFASLCGDKVVPLLGFDELPRGGSDPRCDVEGAVTWQLSTSGTTGLPKGAMLTGCNILDAGASMALEMPEFREGGPFLACMPMFHIGGAGTVIWAMRQGATVFIEREAVPETLLETMLAHKIETTHTGAGHFAAAQRASPGARRRFLPFETHRLWRRADVAGRIAALHRAVRLPVHAILWPDRNDRSVCSLDVRTSSWRAPLVMRTGDAGRPDADRRSGWPRIAARRNRRDRLSRAEPDGWLLASPRRDRRGNARRLVPYGRRRYHGRRRLHLHQGPHQGHDRLRRPRIFIRRKSKPCWPAIPMFSTLP